MNMSPQLHVFLGATSGRGCPKVDQGRKLLVGNSSLAPLSLSPLSLSFSSLHSSHHPFPPCHFLSSFPPSLFPTPSFLFLLFCLFIRISPYFLYPSYSLSCVIDFRCIHHYFPFFPLHLFSIITIPPFVPFHFLCPFIFTLPSSLSSSHPPPIPFFTIYTPFMYPSAPFSSPFTSPSLPRYSFLHYDLFT